MRHEFATPEPPKLALRDRRRPHRDRDADVAETTVEVEAIRGDLEELKVEQHGRDIVIEGRGSASASGATSSTSASAPDGSDVDANIASADVRAPGGSARSR